MFEWFSLSCPILTGFRFPVTYLFRTVGQVLGVAISSAIVQSVVQKDLVRTITGPEAPYVSGYPPPSSDIAVTKKKQKKTPFGMVFIVDHLPYPSLNFCHPDP